MGAGFEVGQPIDAWGEYEESSTLDQDFAALIAVRPSLELGACSHVGRGLGSIRVIKRSQKLFLKSA